MKYKTVVIDFPWPVKGISASSAKKMRYNDKLHMPYKTMSLKEIEAFPINDFAEENCALFMWTTQGFRRKADDIIDRWGFKSSYMITWDKGDGIDWLGFRSISEFVIAAYRGKYPFFVTKGASIPTVIRARQTRHSEKPSIFYDIIRKRTPEPRIDIFARRRHFDFAGWGDGVLPEPITMESWCTLQ